MTTARADGLGGMLARAVEARAAARDTQAGDPVPGAVHRPLLQRYVTDKHGTRIKDARTALIKHLGVPETDLEAMAVIDAVVKDHKQHKWDEVLKMMPERRYVPSGQRETARNTSRPLGFAAEEDFQLFAHLIYKSLWQYSDATIVFHGSSLTGQSFKDKGGGSRLFDVGRDSDYDVAIASPTLFDIAPSAGVKMRGNHSEPLQLPQIKYLGLDKAYELANFNARREVNFMIYQNEVTAHQHEGPALVVHRADNYLEITASLHGNLG